uniref:FAD-binding PCMH-type domain-containing protein n=1 Tax=Anisakis simplex TaxID=6269 RepID=A0A0M3J1R3_ANISI
LIVRDGKEMLIKVKLPEVHPPVKTAERLRIRMNDDHVLIIQDRSRTVADFYLPMEVDYEKASVELIVTERTLQIIAPFYCTADIQDYSCGCFMWYSAVSNCFIAVNSLDPAMLATRLIARHLSSYINKEQPDELLKLQEAASLVPRFEKILGSEFVKTTATARQQHGHDESHHEESQPDVVVMPHSREQVSDILKLCNESRVPVIPFGAGSGLEGGVNAVAVSIFIYL